MASIEGLLRLFGGIGGGNNGMTRLADDLNPDAAYKRSLVEQQRNQEEMTRQFLGSNPQLMAQLNQTIPNAGQYLQSGGDLATLGSLQKILTPKVSKFDENMATVQALMQAPPEVQDMYKNFFGKGGTTVNIGGGENAFNKKFDENLGKQRAEQMVNLETEASDYLSQARSAGQALDLLGKNPDISISPFAPVANSVKSALSDFISEDELKNVSDYQTLDSQLIRNRFDVTKVLKGAITEAEQKAAQTVAGKATGTRQGLEQTLKNNIAFANLQADYNQRKSEFIRQKGVDYSEKEFNDYYKKLGEAGQRPTIESLLGIAPKPKAIEAGAEIDWGDF